MRFIAILLLLSAFGIMAADATGTWNVVALFS